ncbi:MAG: insulinase family protein [Gemmatimonadota bacterium]
MRMITFPRIPTLLLGMTWAAGALLCAPQAKAQDAGTVDAPPPLTPVPLAIPPLEEFQLENGLRVLLVQDSGLPLVTAALYVPGGSAADPPERSGLASMMASTLTQGTPQRTAEEISLAIEGVGGTLNAFANLDFMGVSTSVLATDLELGVGLLAEVALHPIFPESEVELVRTRTLSSLQAAQGQPQQLALRRFLQEVYGDHPYGRRAQPSSVEAIGRGELMEFHRSLFRPGEALLVLAGDVTRERVEPLLAEVFREWLPGQAELEPHPPPTVHEETELHFIHRPGSVQATVFMGHLAIPPDHPDYFPLEVTNRILGGGADSRLFQILREEKGWTYGANSLITRYRDRGFFVAVTEVRNEVADSSVAEMIHQLRRLRAEEIPAGEFQAGQDYLAGSFPLGLETPGQVASQYAEARLLDIPDETFTEYPQRIREVTPQAAQAAARRWIRPERSVIVVVGDAPALLPGLEALEGVDAIQVVDVDGNPLSREDLAPAPAGEPASFRPDLLTASTLQYRLMLQGSPAGTVTYSLARDGEDWVGETRLQGALGQQEVEVRFHAGTLAPVRSSQNAVQGPTTIRGDFHVAENRVTGTASLPPQAGGCREVDVELPAGGLLPGMDDLLLPSLELREGAVFAVEVLDLSTGAFQTLRYAVGAVEPVTVPAGAFQAYRVEVTGGQLPLTLHLREQAPHIMLRQEFQGLPVQVELESISQP